MDQQGIRAEARAGAGQRDLSPRLSAEGEGRRRYALALLLAAFTLSHVDRQIVVILAEPLRLEFDLSDTQLGLLTGFAFAIFYSTLSLPVAAWADRRDRPTILSISLLAWSSMTAVCALAGSFVHLFLARVGVGVGESGASAPAQSLIADLFAPHRRTLALAIFGSGVNLGILLGFGVGGWVHQVFGWRWAFLVAGVPGIVLAALVKLTLVDPRRALPGSSMTDGGVATVAKKMLGNPVVRNSVAGALLASTAGYATIAWVPSFLVRFHGLSTGRVGLLLGLQVGVLGIVGAVGGGYLADRLAYRSAGWRAWVVAVGLVVYLPLAAVAYLAESTAVAVLCFSGPALLSTVHVGVNLSLLQTHMPASMRTRTAAVNLFVVNLVALGGGPVSVGAISDILAWRGVEQNLRWALLTVLVVVCLAAFQFLRLGWILDKSPPVEA